MKHTLPWNVTGIPPEARDIARAAASREGSTVGEWLTRRIMAEKAAPVPVPEPKDAISKPQEPSDEPAHQVSAEVSEAAIRRIDDVFRNLTHRMEVSERAQLEAQRAMSAAAGEINAATRDQAEAFQLIAARIDRVERQTDTGPLRDAVRGLHQGLSRLAEQIAKTTDETSGRIAALNGNFEVLAGKMALTRDDSHHLGMALEEKIAVLDQRAKDNEDRLKKAEERIALVSKLAESVASLEERVNATEERIQQSLGRYLTGIEHRLDEIGERMERAESRPDSNAAIKEALRSLEARVAGQKEPASVLSDLAEIAVSETQNPDTESAIPALADVAGDEAVSLVDAPPTGANLHTQQTAEAPPLVNAAEVPPMVDAAEAPPPVDAAEAPPPTEEMERRRDLRLADLRMPPRVHSSTENYLAQARRAARTVPGHASRAIELQIGAHRDIHVRRRVARPATMAFLVLLLIGAGFMVTRAIERANLMALSSPAYIALEAPPLGPAAGQPAVAPSNGVAAASIFNFGETDSPDFAELAAKANGGDAKAAMALGLKYANGDGVGVNDAQAAYWLQRAAQAGEAVAQYRLGTFYEHGRGFATDLRQALRWYGEAAKAGNRRAMHNLGVLYADGSGSDKNFAEAARWFRSAAELGLMDSQFNLAVLYERGLGVNTSLSEAYKWYSIAAEAGDAESQARVAAIMSQIAPADRDIADRAAKAYKPRPIDVAANDG